MREAPAVRIEGDAPVDAIAPVAPTLTPMIRQYLEAKERAQDAFLFFRLGDFYELFFEDAVRAAEILQITLTARSKGPERVPMCGVPYHSARRYVGKLLEAGHKVAICEQVEAPGTGPGIVRRDIVRVITPGTVLDEDALDASRPSFLAAVCLEGERSGAAWLDASTGEFHAFEADTLAALGEALAAAEPRELLVPRNAPVPFRERLERWFPHLRISAVDAAAFDPARATAYLKAHFRVASLEGFGLSRKPRAVSAAGAALRYVRDTQRSEARHVTTLRVLAREGVLVLDEPTRCNLEVLRTLREGTRAGSLLGVLDRTVTPLGARRLAGWLTAPLRDLAAIEARLDAVEELVSQGLLRARAEALLRRVADVERLCGRLATGMGTARDLAALHRSLAAFPELSAAFGACSAPLWRALSGPLGCFGELRDLLGRAVLDAPAAGLDEGGMIRPGFSEELDRLTASSLDGKSTLAGIEQRERARTGIANLKVRYNRVFGYFLEVTRASLHLVPVDWQRKQTTVGSERYVTLELKTWEEHVLGAEERRATLERELFEELRGRVLAEAVALRAAADAVATSDALCSFARCAAEYGYCRPVVDDSDVLEIVGGRHPVVERVSRGEPFVPNDLRLEGGSAQLLVLTGPNMAGKSTLMRQAALTVLLAQAGSFVPASRARIGACDRIFTRVGAADDLAQGQSTFMVEMTETASILHHATGKSLVLLDEIGRGTSTDDGLSIAWAVAEHLHDRIGARTLFATHYHELIALARERPRVRNASMGVREVDGRVVFLRTLVDGGTSRSYGLEVARLAGLPGPVLRRAREILAGLEAGDPVAGRVAPGEERLETLPVFPRDAPAMSEGDARALEALRACVPDALTPLQALTLLAELRALL